MTIARQRVELALQRVEPQQVSVRGMTLLVQRWEKWRLLQTNFQDLDDVGRFAKELSEYAERLKGDRE